MLATPAVILSAAATLLAILVVFYTLFRTMALRGKYKIQAPAITGHPEFERAGRVHMNTIEQFVIFLPLLWLATLYFHVVGWLPAVLGLLWCIGRIIYAVSYMGEPNRRGPGFGITMLASLALLVLAVIGVINAWMVTGAV